MKTLKFLMLVAALAMVPGLSFAEHGTPPVVPPLVVDGVKYVAPNDPGNPGEVEAWDAQTHHKLWDVAVYEMSADATGGRAAQWVFITALEIKGGCLVVTDEHGERYDVNLKTRAVQKIIPAPPEFPPSTP